ncbi:MAG: HEAT repeat domain-containing protein [Ferruginibacter sp.]
MDLSNYIEILACTKQGWFFKKDNTPERLNALIKIAEIGKPGTIFNLIPFLKDNYKDIQIATCNTIVELFKKIETRKGYYDTLKYCNISTADVGNYQTVFQGEQLNTILSIATLNCNGYVREKAIKELVKTHNQKAIPFILFRLSDWVKPVRDSALEGIRKFKKPEFINALVDNLAVVEWIQKVQRIDLSSVHSEIMKFVLVDNRDYVLEHFKTFTDRTRILIAKQISFSKIVDSADMRLLLKDNHFLIRNLALNHFDKLTETEVDSLLKDKSAKVRIQTLYKLKGQSNFADIILPFLFDNSASIRELAQYRLKNEQLDFARLYNENLMAKRDIIGSLAGLGETNGKQFVENIHPYLNDQNIKIRKAAFLTLRKLDSKEAYNFALLNLDSEFIGLRNLVIEYLSKSATPEVLNKARATYSSGRLYLKEPMLKLFSKIGGWPVIGDIIVGTIDEDEKIRRLSLAYLQRWKKRSVKYFIQPKDGELERANKILNHALNIHDEKKYYSENPLTELNFYLR